MATSKEFVEFVCDQIEGTGDIRYRKMFGEYMVYLNDRPVLLVCDNTVYVKMLDEVSFLLETADKGFPYDGAKLRYILDIENRELSKQVVIAVEAVTPIPKKRKK